MRSEFADFINAMPAEQLACRDWGHNWDRRTSAVRIENGQIHSARTCSSCEAQAVRIQTTSGVVLGRRMIYPPGYLAKGLGRMDARDRAALRVVALEQAGANR